MCLSSNRNLEYLNFLADDIFATINDNQLCIAFINFCCEFESYFVFKTSLRFLFQTAKLLLIAEMIQGMH
jgi:hypothetical protein